MDCSTYVAAQRGPLAFWRAGEQAPGVIKSTRRVAILVNPEPTMRIYDHEGVPAPGCRFCGADLTDTVVDLGMSPLCESYLRGDQLNSMEPFYPLHVFV